MAIKKDGKKGSYSAQDITVLEGLEPVRKRPGMYIGTTGPEGLHHLIWEAFDNARDEAMAGHADDIEVVLLPNNLIRVADNGRGIPVDMHPQTKVSALETIMTTLHAGGKFGGEGYTVSGGLHGVGISVANALSNYACAIVYRDGGEFTQEYKRGKQQAKVKRVGPSKNRGTVVMFEPDDSIFEEVVFDFGKIVARLRQQAYLVRGMRVTIIDARGYQGKLDPHGVHYIKDLKLDIPSMAFYFEGGLTSLVKFLNQTEKPVHKNVFYVEKPAVEMGVESIEVALQYIDDISSRILAFANNTFNPGGGTHLTGFKTALTRTLNTYARKANILKEKEENFTGDDVLEGITAVISVKLREVQFEGQTKDKLGSVEARGAVENVFGESLAAFLEENPEDARMMVNKTVLALKARKAAKAAKDSVLRKGALEGMTLPGKLADCQSDDVEETELYIVEGDSAGGCFIGDTRVALVDGRNLTFRELVAEHSAGKKNYCYTINDRGNIEIALIENPRRTKQSAEVLKVILDNDEEIICTPDHKFMLKDGSYKQAQDLTPKDSLQPLYRKHSKIGGRITIDGYEMVYDAPKNYWIFTHLLSDEYNKRLGHYERVFGDVIHHTDFMKLNNNPDNLLPLGKQEHLNLHTKHLEKTLHRPDVKEKCTAIKRTSAYREQARAKSLEKRDLFRTNAKKQWENLDYKAYMTRKFLEFYEKNEEYRKQNNVLLNREQKKYWGDRSNRNTHGERVRAYFTANPQKKKELSVLARTQWMNEGLRAWRKEETKKQWTPEFRKKRMDTYNKTYAKKALEVLHGVYVREGRIDHDAYENVRKQSGDRSLLKHETIRSRFFDGDQGRFEDAVVYYNHKIKSITHVSQRVDVYDLEVAETHNFALASGVFVHNSAKMARDRRTQAILPLFGKVLNVERARLDKVLSSDKFRALVIAIGAGIGDEFNMAKLRYGKLVIMADADVDGSHIKTLYLTFFYRYFKQLIEEGHIYIAVSPLYKVKKGKEVVYLYSDEEKIKYLGKDAALAEEVESDEAETSVEDEAEEEVTGKEKKQKISVQRYKGLGEMSAEELWETTMDPARRIIKKVRVEDAQEADKVFDILMGTDVVARKSFIQSNAKAANVDI